MKKFSVLSLVLLLSIVASILSTTLISSIEDFSHGWDVGGYEIKEKNAISFFGLYLKQNKSVADIAKNELANGKNTIILPDSATVITLDNSNFSKRTDIMHHINSVVSLISIGLCIWLLVLIFKVILLFKKEKLFEEINIKRCNKIGIICITLGLLETFVNIFTAITASKVLNLEFYNLSFSHSIDWTTIIIGLIVLIFTEILRISTNIKQEQDLTI